MADDFLFGKEHGDHFSFTETVDANSRSEAVPCKTHSNTFIRISPDTKATCAKIPEARAGKPTVALLEYELVSRAPYRLTQEEVQFAVHLRRIDLPHEELSAMRDELRREFFAKPKACMRTSPLPRSYGFGLHFDREGKVALIPMESDDYLRLSRDESVEQVYAMRNKRE